MTAKYLIRMDDACPTMDLSKWRRVEDALDRFGIKPIVAVVPDNQDHWLMIDPPNAGFWDMVRGWRSKGWTIAMHGDTHVMRETEAKMVLPFYKRSEFAGLPYEAQAEKIRRAWRIFMSQEIEPTVWIAPAHCFDWVTLKAIFNETSIRIVSDGIARDTYFERGFHWLPQQLWSLQERKAGLWTVCLHPNSITKEQASEFERAIERDYASRITSVDKVTLTKRRKTIIDRAYFKYFWMRRDAYSVLLNARDRLNGRA